MKVPIYENQVTEAQAPALNVPSPTSPPPSAFGTDIAARTEQLGGTLENVGGMLADHIAERQRQEQQAQIISADTNFRQDLQNSMFSDEPDPDKGNVPKGVFNRQLGQAKGATVDFDTQYGALRQKYLSQFQNPVQQNEMARLMDENYTHHRQLVIHHEATQDRENQKHIVEGNLKQMVNEAGNLQDPNAFLQQVQMGHDRQYANMKENGYDDASIAAATEKFTKDMAESALMPIVHSTPTEAFDYLEKIAPALTPTVKADLTKTIEVRARQLDELEKYQKNKVYDSNMRDAMLDMFDGKLTLSEAERRYRDDTLKKSDYDVLESKLVKPDYQILRDMEVSDATTFNQIRQEQIRGTSTPGEIMRMIAKGNADGKITKDDSHYLDKMTDSQPRLDLDTQAKAIDDFGRTYMSTKLGDIIPPSIPGASTVANVTLSKNADDVEAMKQDFFKRVDKEGASGERIGQIAHEVMREHVAKRYPEIKRLADLPHVVVGIDGRIQRLLQPGTPTKLKGQYKTTRNAGVTDMEETTGSPPKGEKP